MENLFFSISALQGFIFNITSYSGIKLNAISNEFRISSELSSNFTKIQDKIDSEFQDFIVSDAVMKKFLVVFKEAIDSLENLQAYKSIEEVTKYIERLPKKSNHERLVFKEVDYFKNIMKSPVLDRNLSDSEIKKYLAYIWFVYDILTKKYQRLLTLTKEVEEAVPSEAQSTDYTVDTLCCFFFLLEENNVIKTQSTERLALILRQLMGKGRHKKIKKYLTPKGYKEALSKTNTNLVKSHFGQLFGDIRKIEDKITSDIEEYTR
ncbi:MAG TPA: hypothetical protein ENI23_13610 [bacterium]|nr:hypothetical protein [bacterium]